jgi:hypothetical protein
MASNPENTFPDDDGPFQPPSPAGQSITRESVATTVDENTGEITDEPVLPAGWPRGPVILKEQMPSLAVRLAIPATLAILPAMSICLSPT